MSIWYSIKPQLCPVVNWAKTMHFWFFFLIINFRIKRKLKKKTNIKKKKTFTQSKLRNWGNDYTGTPHFFHFSHSQTKLFLLLLLYCFKTLNNYLIDLNTTEEDETPSSGSSSTSSSSFSVAGLNTSGGSGSNLVVGASTLASASSSVCLELWPTDISTEER